MAHVDIATPGQNEIGLNLMNHLGLIIQISNEQVIAANMAKDCVRADKKLGVSIKPSKTILHLAHNASAGGINILYNHIQKECGTNTVGI